MFAALVRVGVPRWFATILLWVYLGARCIMLGDHVGPALYPRKAVIPGCTWATIIVRAYMCPHADAFLAEARSIMHEHSRALRLALAMYIDDIAIVLSGPLRAAYS